MRDPNHDFGSHDRELSLPDMSALYLVDINYSGSSERTDVQGGSLTGVKPTHKNETLKTTKRELNSPSQSEITSEQILTPTTSAYTPSSPSTCDSSCPEGDESTTPKNLVEKPAFGSFFDPWYPEAEDDKTSTPTNMVDSSTAPSFFDPWCPEVEDDKSETPTASTIYHDLLSAQIHQDELPPQSTTTTDPNKLSTLHKGYIKWLKKTTIEAWPHMSKGGDFELRHYREIHFKLHTGQMGSDDDSFATWAQLYGPLDRILHPANVEPEAWVIAYRVKNSASISVRDGTTTDEGCRRSMSSLDRIRICSFFLPTLTMTFVNAFSSLFVNPANGVLKT